MYNRNTFLFSTAIGLALILGASCAPAGDGEKMRGFIVDQFEFNRGQTLKLIEAIEATGQADRAARWIPPTERVCLGWQLLHIAAAEDNLANKHLEQKDFVSKELSELSRAEDKLDLCRTKLPPFAEIKAYLANSRQNLKKTIAGLDLRKLDEKPTPDAFGTRYKLMNVYIWHEAHHQGQAHLSFNMYKAEFKIPEPKKDE